MKTVKVSNNKYRKYNLFDWIGENRYDIGCAMLTVAIIIVSVLIIRLY